MKRREAYKLLINNLLKVFGNNLKAIVFLVPVQGGMPGKITTMIFF
jgi:hypothetical protein